jgi:hypothetical protein
MLSIDCLQRQTGGGEEVIRVLLQRVSAHLGVQPAAEQSFAIEPWQVIAPIGSGFRPIFVEPS